MRGSAGHPFVCDTISTHILRSRGSLVRVFYDQLNYEVLSEDPATEVQLFCESESSIVIESANFSSAICSAVSAMPW